MWYPAAAKVVQRRSDIPTAQQRSGLLMKQTFFQQEQHGHHDQGQVMVPAPPTAHWIVAPANVLFALLQGLFDPIALPLHEGQAGRRRIRRGVAEAVLDLGRRVDLSAHDQMPWAGLGLFAFHSHTRRCGNSTHNAPFVSSRTVTVRHASAGCRCAHWSTRTAEA